ncbi:MAG: mechanosensitive ion channel family protein [Bacteroidales bacterium]|nr:mechanosensitive ion channel family protein [Bacteroidales bacterium]
MNFWIENIKEASNWNRYIVLLLILVALFFISRLIRLFIQRISKKQLLANYPVYAAFLLALANSISVLMVSFGLIASFTILNFPEKFVDIVSTSKEILMVLSIGFFIYQLVDVPSIWFEKLIDKRESASLNKMFIPVIRKTLRLVVITLIVMQIFQILSEKPITTIIAGLGIGSLAVALAAQDTLKHFIGSFVIAGDKPFDIGDRVVVDGHDGSIESIGLRSTSIRTLEGHLVTIPNGELANRTIQNIGKRPYIRRLANITITYDTPPEKIQEAINIIKKILDNHEGMNPELPPRVNFNNFNSDSLNIQMLFWYHPPEIWDYMAFSEKVNFEIIRQFNEAGIEFAFPTQTVYVAGDKKRPLDFGLNQSTTES